MAVTIENNGFILSGTCPDNLRTGRTRFLQKRRQYIDTQGFIGNRRFAMSGGSEALMRL